MFAARQNQQIGKCTNRSRAIHPSGLQFLLFSLFPYYTALLVCCCFFFFFCLFVFFWQGVIKMNRIMSKPAFCLCQTKTQISCAVTAQLISAFFATRIVQSLYFLNPKFQASSHLLWLYSPVCVGSGRKPRR